MIKVGRKVINGCSRPLANERRVRPVQLGVVVLLGEEAGLTIVAGRHDVQGNTVEMRSGAAEHDPTLDYSGGKAEPAVTAYGNCVLTWGRATACTTRGPERT